ncbi:Clan SC, family S9, unassigned serine peptidase [Tritrichomonas foetus]|uniref:Clan SC, family S9, unassigned serine peptidase n=1 Tax=Tritrichomonas foetus TaxID=1144522 RepID=A0A1J4JE38_9EUKA|nr:Clan SC, family S9, unassigned serine peptidase [Tritrichomonas foetus]|eukprot:OHS95931.1 Clan SC, family S9, unassigned serine peptidase [Tritrichomonas foetus]
MSIPTPPNSISMLIKKGVEAIVRPPRKQYKIEDIPLIFQNDDGRTYIRQPLNLTNTRDQNIVASLYYSTEMNPLGGGPCLIYLHGNASSQIEGQFLVPNVCKYNVFMLCFDFAGCGMSDGEYISLGWFEKQDVEWMMKILKLSFNLSPFILWGRSMGASAAMLAQSPDLKGIIVDSSFTSVPDLCKSIATKTKLPKSFVPIVIWILKKNVVKTANFNIDEVSPLMNAKKSEIPLVLGHAMNDAFIPFEQGKLLYDSYLCPDKIFIPLNKGHNGRRPKSWLQLCIQFILDKFNIYIDMVEIGTSNLKESSSIHFESFNEMCNSAHLSIKPEESISELELIEKLNDIEIDSSYVSDDTITPDQ